MTQRFVVINNKGYRDPMDAIKDEEFRPGLPQAEFDTTARINEFYAVTRWAKNDAGEYKPVAKFFARVFEELESAVKPGELIEFSKIFVIPFLKRKEGSREAA